MVVIEKTVPWWRKALIFALGGIRLGFGLLPRPAKREPIREPMLSDRLEETPEGEALAEPTPQPEAAVPAQPILAELEAEPAPAAEPAPQMLEAAFIDPIPAEIDPAEATEAEAGPEALPEPVGSAEAVVVAEPDAVEAPEVEAENEPLPEPIEAAEPIAEAEPEAAGTAEAEAANEPVPEQDEAAEAIAEAEPEACPEAVSAAAIEEALPAAEAPATAIAAFPPSEPPPADAPEPPAEAAASPARAARPTTEEKAAARLAARQKRLDESAEQSPFSVIVGQVYDGPLDLLLDLIRKQDIDIYDIPIARITAQFLAYVNQLRAGDVDVAGEFIYTASLLIHIKSRMLLPRTEAAPEEAAEDPRRELVERLLEHERFKNAAQMLQQKQMLEAATWSNPGAREFQGDEATEPEIAADTVDLVRIFRDILERARKRPILDVSEDTVTVGQMIQYLARRLNMEDKPVALRRLLSHTRSERALIAIFLALLELVRLQAVLLRQDRQFSEIFIKKHTGFDAVMNEGLANARDDWR
jgi:segregation and condensation protein A